MIKCEYCGTNNSDNAPGCIACGGELKLTISTSVNKYTEWRDLISNKKSKKYDTFIQYAKQGWLTY